MGAVRILKKKKIFSNYFLSKLRLDYLKEENISYTLVVAGDSAWTW